jgi:hypothetical protein
MISRFNAAGLPGGLLRSSLIMNRIAIFTTLCLAAAGAGLADSRRAAMAGEPLQSAAARLTLTKDAWTFAASGDRTLLEYRPKPSPMKPYIKRLYTPGGAQVLRDLVPDHKHHHGLMFALGVDGINFWEENTEAGKQLPRPERRDGNDEKKASSSFSQTIDWVDDHGKNLLTEKRTIGVVVANAPDPATLVSWTSELSPATGPAPIKLSGDHFYGLGMRFLASMDTGGRFFNSSGQPGDVVRGSERLVSARWCAYTAKADGRPVTVAIFDHPANPRHPNKIFTMTSPFAYLSATLNLWKEPLTLKSGAKLKLSYAVALWDGESSPKQVESLYRQWRGAMSD